MMGYFQVGTKCIRNGSTLSVPSYSRDSWHREPIYVTIFLAQRSPERFGTVLQTSRTVRNGSADLNFARRYFSRLQEQGGQKNDKGKATSPPKSLNRQCKGMLSTREKVKLDVDYTRLEVSPAVCSWKAWPNSKSYLSWKTVLWKSVLTKSYKLCSLYWHIRLKSIACVESSLLMVLVCVLFVQTLCIKVK